MHTQLDLYQQNIEATIDDVKALRSATVSIGYFVTAGGLATQAYKSIAGAAEETQKGLFLTQRALDVIGLASPLKTPTSALKRVLDKLNPPVKKLDDKLEQISNKDDVTTPVKEKDNEFLNKIIDNLGDAGLALNVARDAMTSQIWRLENTSEAMSQFRTVLPVALRAGEDWSGRYDPLNQAIEAQLASRNVLAADVQEFFSGVKPQIDAFLEALVVIDFEKIEAELTDFQNIKAIFDFLAKPLEAAESLIAPIADLLNAVSSLVSLVIDPIIDYVIETLQLDRLLDSVQEKLDALLPSIDLLDKFFDLMQDLQDFLLEYLDDFMDSIEYLDLVENSFFGNVVGEADQGPTGWDYDLINILEGDAGDDILAGLDGRDTVRGGGGDDIILGGTGDDELDGGSGNDLFYFDASFAEYELARDPETNNIIVNHVRPSDPDAATGIDILVGPLDDHDNVVFTDISFTGEELNNAIIGGSTLNGNNDDNLIFLNSQGVPVSGYHVANGFGGDDRIFGSTENDSLNGGSGNDVLFPGFGDDIANGNSGNDTFQVLEGGSTVGLRVSLLDGTAFGQGRDTLNSIENLVLAPDREHQVEASDAVNYISTGDDIDVITALGGDDTIDSGGEDDFVIGGQGADVIRAGDGRDILISGSSAVAGVSDFYDGGEGFDVVTYTSERNAISSDIRGTSNTTPAYYVRLREFLDESPESGPVEIRSGDQEIIRFDNSGNQVAVDRTVNVEGFSGSDKADMIYGDIAVEYLHGAGGNDTIHTGGTDSVDGGDGDDYILLELPDGGASNLFIDGDSGFDTLDLSGVDNARWYYHRFGSVSLRVEAHTSTLEGARLNNAFSSTRIVSVKPKDIEQVFLGDFADHVDWDPEGGGNFQFFLGGGDDLFESDSGKNEVFAGDGNDHGIMSNAGIFHGEAGDDLVELRASGNNAQIYMGDGRDFVDVSRYDGHVDGGAGFDSISFTIIRESRIEAFLNFGTVNSFKGVISNNAESVEMTIENFEELIATEFNDFIQGADVDEQFLGRGGNDTIKGRDGRDKIYGGDGNDQIEGQAGDDLLHGGAGNDLIDGGSGDRDVASYSWARPGAFDGALVAANFGSVEVDLNTGLATGAMGTDTLIGIEDVVGSGGSDTLRGNFANNLLSGEDGDDRLLGNGGDDVLVTGRGNDVASGGSGDDVVVVGIGTKSLFGGTGFDALDFGTVEGFVTIDFAAGTYSGEFVDKTPRWSNLDTNNDGIDDSDGTEVRFFNGQAITPLMALEADPQFSNSADDTTRVLPDSDDPEFNNFTVQLVDVTVDSSGTFSDFEKVIGGESGANIILTNGVDRFDGQVSRRDVIDLSNSTQAITYNLRTGENNVSLLEGDEVTGIDGVMGGIRSDSFTGTGSANIFHGGGGGDDVQGSGGDDIINGDDGNDTLRGGRDEDMIDGGEGNDVIRGQSNGDTLKGGGGDDNIKGGGGNDHIEGQNGNDFLKGGSRVDVVMGGDGNDILAGNSFNDTLDGGAGDDRLRAGGDDDRLIGGRGDDFLRSGAGNDVFVFDIGHDRDEVDDLNLGSDVLEISAALANGRNAQGIENIAKVIGPNVEIDFGNGDVIVLSGFDTTEGLAEVISIV